MAHGRLRSACAHRVDLHQPSNGKTADATRGSSLGPPGGWGGGGSGLALLDQGRHPDCDRCGSHGPAQIRVEGNWLRRGRTNPRGRGASALTPVRRQQGPLSPPPACRSSSIHDEHRRAVHEPRSGARHGPGLVYVALPIAIRAVRREGGELGGGRGAGECALCHSRGGIGASPPLNGSPSWRTRSPRRHRRRSARGRG